MNKENLLFGVVGLLLGLIIGFIVTNRLNDAVPVTVGTAANQAAPGTHPDLPSAPGSAQSMPQIQEAIDKAAKEPDNFDAQLKAAELYYQIQRYDSAASYLAKANELKPDNYEVLVALGNATFDSGKFDDAEKWYGSALKQKPDDVNVRTDLGLTFVLRQTPDYDRAIKEFKRSLETDPNHVKTIQNLTVGYTKKGDYENATATLKRLEELDPKNEALAKLSSEIQGLKK